MAIPSYDALGLMIEKLSRFIEWIFEKKKKSELVEIEELNSILKNQFNFSIIEISENPIDVVKTKLKKIDVFFLDKTISELYKATISKNDNQIFQRLKLNAKLDYRIMELILFAEINFNKSSMERNNIKNSLQERLNSVTH